jgi:hypothetical protein
MSSDVKTNAPLSIPRPSPIEERAAAQEVTAKQPGVLQKLINLTFDRRALLLVIFLLIAGLVVQPWLFVSRLLEPEKIFAIDAEGNLIIGPAVSFNKSTKLHSLIAAQATVGLLARNPAGFSNEDFLTTLFADAPLAKARAEWKKEEEDYKKREIRQSVRIHAVHVSVAGDDYYLRVSGELDRILTDNLQSFTESPPFQVVFHCKRNPRVFANYRPGLVVVDYHYEPISAP